MTKQINFRTTSADIALIAKIADRYQAVERQHRDAGQRRDRTSIVMDFCAIQNSETPLDLQRLLDADDGTFAHDAFGIERHLNRETGELGDCFLPRTARKQHETSHWGGDDERAEARQMGLTARS